MSTHNDKTGKGGSKGDAPLEDDRPAELPTKLAHENVKDEPMVPRYEKRFTTFSGVDEKKLFVIEDKASGVEHTSRGQRAASGSPTADTTAAAANESPSAFSVEGLMRKAKEMLAFTPQTPPVETTTAAASELPPNLRDTTDRVVLADGSPRDAREALKMLNDKAAAPIKPIYGEADTAALNVISEKIVATEAALAQKIAMEKVQGKTAAPDAQVKRGGDINVRALGPGEIAAALRTVVDGWIPGDLNQTVVNDLGVGAVAVADLKGSSGTTSVVDHALSQARLDPKHYNCNDYVKMFVLGKEGSDKLAAYIATLNHPAITDSPEGFLREHGYAPIKAAPLHEGDVIVVHTPSGEHAAVICRDKDGKLYTMQKPNPTEMPVRLSFGLFNRAEGVANATSVQVFRKSPVIKT